MPGARSFFRSKTAMGVVMLGAGLLAGFAVGYFDAGPWVILAVLAPLLGLGIWFSARWLASLDEVAREAHKWAWYWGGSTGLAVAVCILVAVDAAGIPNVLAGLPPWLSDEEPFALGAMLVFATEIVGYLGAWAAWWLVRR